MALEYVVTANLFTMNEKASDYSTAERLIYLYIAGFMRTNGIGPTREEIITGTGISGRTWDRVYGKFAKEGLITCQKRYILDRKMIEIADSHYLPITKRDETD